MKFREQYAFLSNFYPVSIFYAGVFYTSAEHAYQASKCVNIKERERIAALETPSMAKQQGRHIWPIRKDWDQVKLEIMEDILRLKFHRDHIILRRLLAETNPLEIVEENWWNDRYWGQHQGIGHNHLGRLLMKIRAEVLEDDWSASR